MILHNQKICVNAGKRSFVKLYLIILWGILDKRVKCEMEAVKEYKRVMQSLTSVDM